MRVCEWPLGSFATVVTVYVWFFAGVNAGVNDTDWSVPSGAFEIARLTSFEPSCTEYESPIGVPVAE